MRVTYIISGITLLMLTSCVSANIISNKAPNYDKKLSRVYIMANVAPEAKPYILKMVGELGRELKKRGLEVESVIRDPLSLESEADQLDAIQKWNPQHVMTIKQTQGNTANGTVTGGDFEISIIDGERQKIVWKSVLEAFGSISINKASSESVKKLLEQLQRDQML